MRWLSGGCVVLLLLVIGAAAVSWWYVQQFQRPLNSLINGHFEAMARGDWKGAYERMAPVFQRRVSLDDFRARWSKHAWLLKRPHFSAGQLALTEDKGWTVSGEVTFEAPGVGQARYELQLGKTAAEDRILEFEWQDGP
jgi:hypothetical protein